MSVTVLHDRQTYSKGRYYAYPSDWSQLAKQTLVRGKDYRNDTTIDVEHFPNNTLLAWLWPSSGSVSPRGYTHLAYGDYRWPSLEPIPARQVGAISTLAASYDVELHGDRAQFNLLCETFLTAGPGSKAPVAFEVGFLPSLSFTGRAWFGKCKQLGTFTDASKRAWKAAVSGQYAMFIPASGKEVPSAALDFAGAFAFLTAADLLTGKEWFNGLAIGVEPVNGSGSALVKAFSVTIS